MTRAGHGRRPWSASVGALYLIPIVASTAAGQDDAGSIWGVVADELGGLLPGVTVTVRHDATGLARSAVTGNVGSYEIARLPAGDYEVSVFLPGFRAAPTAARVAGAETIVDFTLTIAPLAETVTVTRSEQGLDDVANAVAVLGPEALGFTERKASLDEALRGVPGLTVQNRRDYGLTGGIALSVRAPPSHPMLGIRGLAVIQDGIPLTTTDGTTAERACINEELFQVFGLLNDVDESPLTMLDQGGYSESSTPTEYDRMLLRLLYHPRMETGLDHHWARHRAMELLPELRERGTRGGEAAGGFRASRVPKSDMAATGR